MKTTCPHCQNSAKITEEHLGKQVRCKKCGGTFRASCDPFDESVDVAADRQSASPSSDAVSVPAGESLLSPTPPAPTPSLSGGSASTSDGAAKRYYVRRLADASHNGPYTQAQIDKFVEMGQWPGTYDKIEATVEGLLIRLIEHVRKQERMIEIQERQLHWLQVMALFIAVAFALVFVFGMTLKVK